MTVRRSKPYKSKEFLLRTESCVSSELQSSTSSFGWLDAGIGKLEQLGNRVESALAGRSWITVFVAALTFIACTSWKARLRPFSFDEILTQYISALPSFGAICKTLAAHAESSPPLFHLISKLSGAALGGGALGLRFPAIAGYLAMILCVYFVVSRYTGPLYAALGALATYLTNAPIYSIEARPYGMLLGLSSIALVCWQQAARHRFRGWALAGLWLSLAAALNLHYYAVLTFAAIGFGELVRAWRTRHIDWAVWAALVFATAPLLFLLPLIRTSLVMKSGYFAPATLSRLVNGLMQFYLPAGGLVLAAFTLLAGTCLLVLTGRPAPAISTPREVPPLHEVAAWIACLLAPLAALIVGKLVTKVFVARYAIISAIGFSILLPFCLQRLFRNSRAAALAVLLFLGLCFGMRAAGGSKIENFKTTLLPWLRSSDRSLSPIVIGNPITYLRLAHDADRNFAGSLIYLPDPQEGLKYRGVNTPDYNIAGLRGVAPLNLQSYSSFTSSHPQFVVLWEASRFDWIVPKLSEAGAELRFCRASGSRVLLLVNLSAISAGDRNPSPGAAMDCNEVK